MKSFAVFCLFALIAIANAQQVENEVKFVIDPFTTQSDTIVILIPTGGIVSPITSSNFATSGSIMGGERDLQLTVTGGSGNLVLTTGVSGGVYTSATPNEARGNSLLQLDGTDGDILINTSGLFGHPNNNFMNEEAFAFRVLIESDLPGTVIFRVFFGGAPNQFCSTTVSTPGDDTLNEYILPYSDFSGTVACNFANVGALEIFTGMDDNVDVLLSDWSTYGPVVTCFCNCPEFTCFLQIDNDGYFTYFYTSQLNANNNPTTDLSTIYTSGSTRFYNPTTDLSTIFVSVSSNLFSTFTTFFDSFSFTTFTDGFSSFTSFNGRSSSSSGNGSSSSSSDASVLSVSVLLMTVVAALI